MAHRIVELFTDPFDMVAGLRKNGDPWLNIWGPSLLAPQAIGGLVFINRPEGLVVLIGLIVMFTTAGYIHRHAPLSRLIGICQAWWMMTAPWLLLRVMAQTELTVFSVWLWYVTGTLILSILMSAYGFHLYLTTDNETYGENK